MVPPPALGPSPPPLEHAARAGWPRMERVIRTGPACVAIIWANHARMAGPRAALSVLPAFPPGDVVRGFGATLRWWNCPGIFFSPARRKQVRRLEGERFPFRGLGHQSAARTLAFRCSRHEDSRFGAGLVTATRRASASAGFAGRFPCPKSGPPLARPRARTSMCNAFPLDSEIPPGGRS